MKKNVLLFSCAFLACSVYEQHLSLLTSQAREYVDYKLDWDNEFNKDLNSIASSDDLGNFFVDEMVEDFSTRIFLDQSHLNR